MLEDARAFALLKKYGLGETAVTPLGNHGGFSGARLWRVDSNAGPLCLRAWPPGDPAPDRLTWIHHLMDTGCRSGLAFVPAVLRTSSGQSWIQYEARLWDLCRWLPGQADFRARPSIIRIQAACAALARLHASWATTAATRGTCPAIERRMKAYGEWLQWSRNLGHLPVANSVSSEIADLSTCAWSILQREMEGVPQVLSHMAAAQVPLQPCVCDIWHAHVLYEGEAVSGIIDYGGAKIDHVAVDLARLLGSMAGSDKTLRAAGIDAYRRHRPLDLREENLVWTLDETGALVGLATWLKWLYRDGRKFENTQAVVGRMSELLERFETRRH
jgi:Ser/Thr protein kinase RdoA (MazF antagonist)